MDIVMPDGNEEDFIVMAQKLGIKQLCFLYSGEIPKKKYNVEYGLLVNSISKSKKDSLHKQGIKIFLKPDVKASRAVIESKLVDYIFDIEDTGTKEYLHNRNAGLNQVSAKLLKKNNITLCISMQSLQDSKRMGRSMQNIRLQSKYDFPCLLVSFAKTPLQMCNPKDVESLMRILGLPQ